MGPTKPVLDQTQWKDFQELVTTVELERPALVVARHGVDFLTAWHLQTHVVEEDAFQPVTETNYRAVYMLKENSSKAGANGQNAEEQVIFENKSFQLFRLK